MLDEGAAGRTALDLASALELLGARLSVGASAQSASMSLHVPVARLQDALRIATDVVLRPDFPAAELDRLRTERLTGLVRAHDSPNAVAGALLSKTLFGADHPYGRMTTAADLRAITVADVRRFYQSHWRPDNTTAIVVGDMTASAARSALEAAFGDWQPGTVAARAVADAPQVTGRRIYIVDKPGAAQSVMILGRIGVPRSTADYFPLEVMNTILGGSFTSRLNQNLREAHGYSYGARSNFDYRAAAGPFTASSSVQTQSTGAALHEFMVELQRIRTDITGEEVERAKNNLAMSYAPGFQSVAGIAARLADRVLYDLPPDYFNQYTSRVLAVTPADVERVARTYIDPDNIAVIIVGDRSRIESQVRQQDLGPIQFLSIDDVLGPVPDLK
jgi:predicted Zn-dependent peptidase